MPAGDQNETQCNRDCTGTGGGMKANLSPAVGADGVGAAGDRMSRPQKSAGISDREVSPEKVDRTSRNVSAAVGPKTASHGRNQVSRARV